MNKFLTKFFFFFTILLELLFVFPEKIYAGNILFTDDFEDPVQSEARWIVAGPQLYNGDGSDANWRFESGMYGILITNRGGQFNETVPTDDRWNMDWKDYIFEVDFKLVRGADTNLVFRYVAHNKWYGIHGINNEHKLYLQKVGWSPWSSIPTVRTFYYQYNIWYRIKVEVLNGNIKISIKNLETEETIVPWDLYDPAVNSSYGKPGLQASTGGVTTTEVWFDNVVVTGLGVEPTPTPTPTPTPSLTPTPTSTPTPSLTPTPTPTFSPSPTPTQTIQPLIFLPGLGGSWNYQEIFLGIDQPQSAWYKTPFDDTYQGLIQTLQNAGYALDENLFVFYYDWLQPIDQSTNDLKNYIQTIVNPSPGTKLDLLGHSLGGLVARAYIQKNPGSHQIDQLITVGSPHKGVTQIYKAWEGADLNQLLGKKERVAAGILLRLRGFRYPNLVQAIRNLIPSLGNLLFIDDYLKYKKTGIIKPEPGMFQQNTWLKGLGISSELLPLANTLLGTAGNTPRWLKIVARSQIDLSMGRWEDGKPVDEEASIGDKTVLEESARLEGANIIPLAGLDHGDLVESSQGQEKILEILGVANGVAIVEQEEIPFEPALVFTVASPVNLRVSDPLGRQIGAGVEFPEIPRATYLAEEKMIIVRDALNGEYLVEIIRENDGGDYQLLIGQLTSNQDLWTAYQGEIGSSQSDFYTLPFNSTFTETDIFLSQLINSKLGELLRSVRRLNIDLHLKLKLMSLISRILSRTRPVPTLLALGKNRNATNLTQQAILQSIKAINYVEDFYPDLLIPLREILDLLGELYQLLGK